MPFKRLLIGTKLYLSFRLSTASKTPKGLKDSICEKGDLESRLPVLYVPPMDLLQMKDSSETLMVKLANETV